MDAEIEDNIHVAIMKDNLEDFSNLILNLKNWDNYYVKDFEEYLIHTAIRNKAARIINFIFDKNVSLTVIDRSSKTPLHLALEEGLCGVVKRIINMNAESTKDSWGNNELHKWVIYHSKCEPCLRDLKSLKNDLTGKNNKGNNPLHQAVIDEDLEAIRLLVSKKYFSFNFINTGDNDSTLIHLAAPSKSKLVFEYLLNLNVIDINKKNSKLQTALTISILNENYIISEKLISLGAKVSTTDKQIAYEKTNRSLYSKLKQLYEKQQAGKNRANSFNNTCHLTDAKKKSSVMAEYQDEIITEDLDHTIKRTKLLNHTIKRTKFSEGFKMLKVNKFNLDSNSNSNKSQIQNDNLSNESTKGLIYHARKYSENQIRANENKNSVINPFNNANSNSKSSKIVSDIFKIQENRSGSSHNFSSKNNNNSNTTLSSSPKKTKLRTKGPILATLSSNFFNNSNNCAPTITPPVASSLYSQEQKPISPGFYLNNIFNFDSLINFEFIKSFTSLEFKDIIKEELIYSAEICRVYKGKYLHLPVAIKEYNIAKLKEDDHKYFISEVNLLMSLRHPNVVTFIGTCCDKNVFYQVTEYLEKKSLKSVLVDKKSELSLVDKLRICNNIAIAILYLHSRKPQVFHRDLKSSNCLVDENFRIKLCDFGLSKIYEELKTRTSGRNEINSGFYQTNCTGTSFWMAPEFITENLFTDKADIYAFGILMWEIMMRDPVPYKNISEIAFLCGDKEILKQRPLISPDFDPDIKELMQSCWHSDYKQRPDIATVVDSIESLIRLKTIK